MKSTFVRWGAVALMIGALAGCGGGGGGGSDVTPTPTPTPTPPPGVPQDGTNSVPATSASSAAWAALAPQVTITGVTIASAPAVKFTVKDAAGKPVIGLGNKSQAATATVKVLTNVGFTLAKLVPGTNGAPSKWVSYSVLRPPTVAEKAGTVAATASCNSATAPTWCGTFPTTDTQGTLVDNGDGSYQYTFYRDPKQVATLAAGLIDTADGLTKKADFGDLSYDASLTHRLGIIISGNAPGSGTNTPTGVASATAAVAMLNPANATYDFRPDGGTVSATRDIVMIESCTECHQGKPLAHGGSRKDPKLCVTCHTDQVKYSFSREAPMNADGVTLTGGGATTQEKRANQAIIDGRAVGNFPNYIHKLHLGKESYGEPPAYEGLVKQGYNFNNDNGAMLFNQNKYPQDIRNCTKCHDGSASAVNKTANGDNWKSVPSRLACGSCHDGINFATGRGTTLARATTGHVGGAKADDSQCALCHDATTIPIYHTAKLPAIADTAQRTMSATISRVAVGATDGSVTVTFSLKDNGAAVTSAAAFKSMAFTLAKLLPSANGASTNWMSYTGRFRTKDATKQPIFQGYSESATAGTLTHTGSGVWTYKFALLNASTPGDIRTVDHAHNVSTVAGAYNNATVPTYQKVVAYEPPLTHRVGMEFQTAAGVDNVTNATFDFVPNGNATAATRNIVTMANCATCHAGRKIHKGYATEYCVTCHNKNTADPFSGDQSVIVDLQRVVHKVHNNGTDYVVNGTSFGSASPNKGFPGKVTNCEVCHVEKTSLANSANWRTMPTSIACGSCHDSAIATAHINSQISGGVEMCVICHAPGGVGDVKAMHANK